MRYQLELFFTALGFFTRLPVPAWVPWSPERLNQSARFFPLVGWVVAAIAAAAWLGFALFLPTSLAVLLSMAVSIRATGCFHEDGWADACDGLGGGWDKAQVLTIMKDSRIGSYGTAGLVLMLAAKACALIALAEEGASAVVSALFAAHALSRLASTSLIHWLPYVREDESAKSKPLARRLESHELAIACAFGLAPLALFDAAEIALVLAFTAITTIWAARMFLRRLGGYTGDLLGATQQATELACYLALLAAAGRGALV